MNVNTLTWLKIYEFEWTWINTPPFYQPFWRLYMISQRFTSILAFVPASPEPHSSFWYICVVPLYFFNNNDVFYVLCILLGILFCVLLCFSEKILRAAQIRPMTTPSILILAHYCFGVNNYELIVMFNWVCLNVYDLVLRLNIYHQTVWIL